MAALTKALLGFFRQAEPRTAPFGWGIALDGAIAVGAAVAAVFEAAQTTSHGPVLGLVALTALPLALRRVFPVAAWLGIIAAITVVQQTTTPPAALGAAVFAAYSAIAHSKYRNLAIAGVVVVTLAATAYSPLPRFPGRLTAVLTIAPTVIAGLGIRELRRRLNDSAARLRRAADEQETATLQAIETERARISAELHDVVTHNVSVMMIQTGAARKMLNTSPGEAEEALLAAEAGGRVAMAELRNLLGLLSAAQRDGESVALHPQPGLHHLPALIERVSAAGLPVELDVSGTPRPLPPGADLAAYRVVQEALTNVLRHTANAATAVTIHWGDELVITVSDNGPGTGGNWGRGLLGLRERLALYGGQFDAGPRAEGGWRVRAVLPA
ncbi:histidine kinase [Streptomyces sp. Li-HN-5-11]|uniref:sensor histidine kinase n=1 Tax=Streptomyces sp. Li-HN-5-11 TaxID=3075432 RepID=UPI0028AF570B|nr:histidine kinase [Streptomyces sp. Li-HN-5-11]WNM31068.1 histidine kinase [Streptomyces sp. Li-HN-5-11]